MDYTVQERLLDREMTVRYTAGNGKQRFHGGSQLKSSQAYPKGCMECGKLILVSIVLF